MLRRKRQRDTPLQFTFDAPPPPPRKPPKPRRRRIRWMRFFTVASLVGLLGLVSAFFGFMTAIAQELPSLDQYGRGRVPDQIGYIYAKNGVDAKGNPIWVKIATLSSPDSRVIVKPDQIAPVMKQAIVAIEDKRFYSHHGVDPEGIVRAVFRKYEGGSTEGASTITQQFVKNTFLTPKQSVQRKIREAALAWQLEERWSKDKILSEYLNTINFGNGAYGIESASRYYFGKHAADLDAGEAALLAAIPKDPTRYDPVRSPADAKSRRDLVLDKMVEQGDITAQAAAIEKASSILPKGWEPHTDTSNTIQPYFVEYVEQQLVNKYGTAKTFGGGLKVYTSLDLKQQKLAQQSLAQNIAGKGPDAAIVSIDPSTGEVTTMAQSTPWVGGPNGHQFNDVTPGQRQPGSAFKPFVLAAALKQGIQPSTVFVSKRQFINIGDPAGPWVVSNDEDSYLGPISVTDAVKHSDNAVFAQLTMAVRPAAVVQAAHDLGIVSPLDAGLAGIGLGETEVTPLEMAHAYATIANEGVRIGGSVLFNSPESQWRGPEDASMYPISIEKVRYPDGTELDNKPQAVRVMDQVDAQSEIDAMRGVLTNDGTGRRAAIGRPAAGKTGTTTGNVDAWFVGFTPQLATATWVGYETGSRQMKTEFDGKQVMGGTYPAMIWRSFMTWALRGQPAKDWDHSPGKSSEAVDIDTRTWTRTTAGCTSGHELVLAIDKVPEQTSSCPSDLFIVPNYINKTQNDARKQLDGSGLDARVQLVPAGLLDTPGTVIDQSPEPLQYASIGEVLTLKVAQPVTRIIVPGVASTKGHTVTMSQAIATLTAQHFRVVLRQIGATASARDGTVVEQSPKAGGQAPSGSVVLLSVAGNVQGTTIPKLVGLTLAQAQNRLAALGIDVTARRDTGAATLPDDSVIDAEPGEGSLVPDGSSIVLRTVPKGAGAA